MEKRGSFWLDSIVEKAIKEKKLQKEKQVTIACGWSASGSIHIGNFRPDAIIPYFFGKVLREKGFSTRNILVVYTQDRFKAKPEQLLFFENLQEAEKHVGIPQNYFLDAELLQKYKGIRLIDVPDPYKCHTSWAEHFYSEAIQTFSQLGIEFETITTTNFYKLDETKKLMKEIFAKKEEIRQLLNKYRKEKLQEDWHPLDPFCPRCKNIADNKILSVDEEKWQCILHCSKCNSDSLSSIEDGKLDWKLEWSALWNVFNVSIEPYGKDHAVVGGSRDISKEIQQNIYQGNPPFGFFCEWIGKIYQGNDLGDMTSSGNILFTPKQFLQIAPPEMLRFFFLWHDPTRRFAFDFENIAAYYEEYDKAERICYGFEKASEKEKADILRAFRLAQLKKIPRKFPYQLNFNFVSLLAQLIKKDELIPFLKKLGHLKKTSKEERERIIKRYEYAKNWLELFAPEEKKIKIREKVDEEILKKFSEKEKKALSMFKEVLEKEASEGEIAKEIKNICTETGIETKSFYRVAYLLLFGKEQGPRLVTLAMISREKIKKLLEQI